MPHSAELPPLPLTLFTAMALNVCAREFCPSAEGLNVGAAAFLPPLAAYATPEEEVPEFAAEDPSEYGLPDPLESGWAAVLSNDCMPDLSPDLESDLWSGADVWQMLSDADLGVWCGDDACDDDSFASRIEGEWRCLTPEERLTLVDGLQAHSAFKREMSAGWLTLPLETRKGLSTRLLQCGRQRGLRKKWQAAPLEERRLLAGRMEARAALQRAVLDDPTGYTHPAAPSADLSTVHDAIVADCGRDSWTLWQYRTVLAQVRRHRELSPEERELQRRVEALDRTAGSDALPRATARPLTLAELLGSSPTHNGGDQSDCTSAPLSNSVEGSRPEVDRAMAVLDAFFGPPRPPAPPRAPPHTAHSTPGLVAGRDASRVFFEPVVAPQ